MVLSIVEQVFDQDVLMTRKEAVYLIQHLPLVMAPLIVRLCQQFQIDPRELPIPDHPPTGPCNCLSRKLVG